MLTEKDYCDYDSVAVDSTAFWRGYQYHKRFGEEE